MKKIIFIFSLIIFFTNSAFAQEVMSPKSPAYRLGVTYDIEKEYKVTDITERKAEKTASYAKEYIKNVTYADSSLKDLSNEISKLLTIEKEEMLEHIQILWAGTALRSETIKFALYKLANPDADKPDESIIKKIIRNVKIPDQSVRDF